MNCKHQRQITEWLYQDPSRVRALEVAEQVMQAQGIKDYLLAAGFVRNLVWDKLHSKELITSLSDIDVIYYEANELSEDKDKSLEAMLNEQLRLPWSVKNQARMHIRNGDNPYVSIIDAMSYWPEKETAIGVRLENNEIVVQSAFDLQSLFSLEVTYNPKRSLSAFNQRVKSKHWLLTYPKLTVICSH
ncbi:nucleotidyltransferase family protein [Parashewanella curva]|uniref:nucleotidyltransferase family protein n=1 Tax=Parashewanella curva TaxID=2338552 RepID=UPI001FB2CAE6|nr:nucleotidyltransferase family protein [Parashewanella curva]